MKIPILYVLAEHLLLVIFFVLFFKKLLIRLLKKQQSELEKVCENKIGELQHYYNHYGILPANVSLLGLIRIISLGIGIRIASLKERLKNKDWNTAFDIEEFTHMLNQEVKKAEKLAKMIDDENRRRLKDFKYKEDDT